MMPQTPASVSNYEVYLHCSSTDGSLAVEKMKALLDCMSPPDCALTDKLLC